VAEQGEGVGLVVVGREDHHAGSGMAPPDLMGGLDPLQSKVRRHLDVGHHHVRQMLAGRGEQAGGIFGHTHDLDVLGDRQQGPDALANEDVVVAQHHPDRHRPPPPGPLDPRAASGGRGAPAVYTTSCR